MDYRFHLQVLVFMLALVVSHAASPSEVYWKSMLPNTPMPKAIQDLLPEDKNAAAMGGQDGQAVQEDGVSVGVGGGGVSVDIGHHNHTGSPHVRVKPPYVGKQPWAPFDYKYAASEDQLHDNPNIALFFLEKDLHHPGTKMNLHFTRTTAKTNFLPRKIADNIPFSSNKFSEILNRFSIKPETEEAQVIKKTIEECEEPAMEGEDKYCATSLESMVDFSISKIGKNAQPVSTEVDKEESHQQKFTVLPGLKKMAAAAGNKTVVVCHGQKYAYPVFYCHATHATRAYVVPLVGADGVKAKAVAVCHTNTSNWNPKHLAFQVLKVEPGSVPICHFLPEDHIVWVST